MTNQELVAKLRQALSFINSVIEELKLISPPSPTSDEPSLEDIKWLHTNISKWKVTSVISDISISSKKICIEHTKAGKWPKYGSKGNEVEGNPWIIAKVGNHWYAATYEWLRPGQTCKKLGTDKTGKTIAESIGLHTKRPPLETWIPESGELVGFMISALARSSDRTVEERSNIVWKKWP